ncbi:hypothetical protein ACFW08_05755 [Streptomyces sp. NPDC058960]|uniref:hypothetical protein n=1 Tax=Streptomyces sp. NPDC058960 TaxID=3346679 RepID=UPI00369C69A5
MPEHCDSGPTLEEEETEYERARQARIDRYYQGESAADLAERVVDLEDEIGEDVDGVCTGMHADVAEAHAEIERLKRDLRVSEAKVGGAALYVDQVNARASMLENVVAAYDGIHEERDRYRLAWLSARRRAADEANFGTEALERKEVEIRRLRGALERIEAAADEFRMLSAGRIREELEAVRKTTHAPRLECVGSDEDGEVWRLGSR